MQKYIKTGILIVFFAIFIGTAFYKLKVYSDVFLVTGSDFDIYLANSTLNFQAAYDVSFTCLSGVWNGTNSTLILRLETGSISFIALDDCTLFISTIADRGFSVQASGLTLTQNNGNYSAVITSGPRVTISWRYLPWSAIDNYFMLGVGITGIVMLIAGPTWFARTFIKHGLDTETVEHLGYAMLFIIMGFGFMVVWLWPG